MIIDTMNCDFIMLTDNISNVGLRSCNLNRIPYLYYFILCLGNFVTCSIILLKCSTVDLGCVRPIYGSGYICYAIIQADRFRRTVAYSRYGRLPQFDCRSIGKETLPFTYCNQFSLPSVTLAAENQYICRENIAF